MGMSRSSNSCAVAGTNEVAVLSLFLPSLPFCMSLPPSPVSLLRSLSLSVSLSKVVLALITPWLKAGGGVKKWACVLKPYMDQCPYTATDTGTHNDPHMQSWKKNWSKMMQWKNPLPGDQDNVQHILLERELTHDCTNVCGRHMLCMLHWSFVVFKCTQLYSHIHLIWAPYLSVFFNNAT